MRVIPACPVKIGFEAIRERAAWSNWTLLDRRHAIKPWGRFLQETMPVQRRAFFGTGNLIVDSYLDGISPIGFYRRTWELSVD